MRTQSIKSKSPCDGLSVSNQLSVSPCDGLSVGNELSLKHPRSIRGGLLPHQYINKHTLICVRYTYVHDFFYISSYVTWPSIVSLITFTLYTAICIHNYTCISKHTRQEALACVFARDLNLPRGVLQNPQNPPQLRLCLPDTLTKKVQRREKIWKSCQE